MAELSKADKEVMEHMKFLRELLLKFGLTLRDYEPGITAFKYREHYDIFFDFTDDEWKWLEPLLIELNEYRNKTK